MSGCHEPITFYKDSAYKDSAWALVEIEELATLISCALRYALGRHSYITSSVAGIIKNNTCYLSELDKDKLIRDLREELLFTKGRSSIDDEIWDDLLQYLLGERKDGV